VLYDGQPIVAPVLYFRTGSQVNLGLELGLGSDLVSFLLILQYKRSYIQKIETKYVNGWEPCSAVVRMLG